jgi:uncharacterized protein (TIGR02231 family)
MNFTLKIQTNLSLAKRGGALFMTVAVLSICSSAQDTEALIGIDSVVSDVTVYGESAIVTRHAYLPAAEGQFRISGLPSAMDPASIRVRTTGGEVVGVDTRLQYAQAATGARVVELEAAWKSATRAWEHKTDAAQTARDLVGYYDRLLVQERELFQSELAAGSADLQRWEEGVTFFEAEFKRVRDDSRVAGWELEDAEQAVKAARTALSGARTPSGAFTYDLEIDVVSRGGASELEVEYLVAQAGWTPLYDLRAERQLKSVELVYRAKVQQNTGEDWEDVNLMLSSARPELGSRGPELEMTWIGLLDPSTESSSRLPEIMARSDSQNDLSSFWYLGKGETGSWQPSFAGVLDSGLSVRFQLPRRETVESREEPSTLLVGRTALEVEVEHYAVPALSERVWLRGHAQNTSPWTLLPGVASVYFGDDYIGHSALGRVTVGEEFDLHLGADPGLSLERNLIEDQSKGPSLFRSTQSVVESWRVRVTNHGSTSSATDGSVNVIVQEALPQSSDERLKIELESSTPPLSTGERWQRDREERGVLTWILHVPKDGEADLTWARKLTHPEDLEVIGLR